MRIHLHHVNSNGFVAPLPTTSLGVAERVSVSSRDFPNAKRSRVPLQNSYLKQRNPPSRLSLITLSLLTAVTSFAAESFKPEKLAAIDAAVAEAIATKKLPGGVLWIEHAGSIHRKVY